ncbi:hypothetical protein CXB51_031671 [Gossypium anomalum]|uniref:RNase H type-1 domain-containing protein n=1 Tax=Gossypium anomalum TaxID=47600 RepID=A0A8J5Y4S3_9ROSI|nr:hypothetical protein CXB51_031671 [Gossypium anomalum]
MGLLDKKAMADSSAILWNNWNNRNNMLFRGKEETSWVIWERAKSLRKEFCIHNIISRPILPIQNAIKKWEKSLNDKMKINFDATIINDKIGFNVIERDSKGFAISESCGFKEDKLQAEWAEFYALKESIKVARSLNIANAIFETDCASLANKIKNWRVDITIIGQRVNNLFKSMDMLNNVKFKWVNSNCNKAMNFLSNYAITNN